jgi:hypothetical protein
MLLRVLELVLILVLILTIVLEVLVPLLRGTPLFPIFTAGRKRRLESNLRRARLSGDEMAIAAAATKLKRKPGTAVAATHKPPTRRPARTTTD